MELYPLQFDPIFKERIWGGEKLKTLLNKSITSSITGESWELSTVEGDVSVVANGPLKGKSLTTVINESPAAILGTSVYARFGAQFPLLFKYLDAREDLSIQVHPNDALAKKRHNSFGKTVCCCITRPVHSSTAALDTSSPQMSCIATNK